MIEHQLRLNSLGKRAALHSFYGGNAVPDLDFTVEISELLIKPLTVTSVRKVEPFGTVPLCALVWLMSELLTEPLAVVSPRRTAIGTLTSPAFAPSLTPKIVIVSL